MYKLAELKPRKVFEYFEEICNIPHGSGNTKQISDYLVEFAKAHNFQYIQDSYNNVIIIKEASEGYENSEAIIIQGHMDMVCQKTADSDIDFNKDGLDLCVDGDFIYAKNTTLGGDDGIAVAFGLAILDDNKLKHPRIELVVTVDEEIGMLGAAVIDLSMLQGRKLLNIDSEEEGIFLVSCAGGATVSCEIPYSYEKKTAVKYDIAITGIQGGHSGCEIDKERGNSNVLVGRMLNYLSKTAKVYLTKLEGGKADNAIPNHTDVTICIDRDNCETIEKAILKYEEILKNEYKTSDKNIKLTFNKSQEAKYDVIKEADAANISAMLYHAPNGIQRMSMDIKGLVETSLNLGILKTEADKVTFMYSVRSSLDSQKYAVIDKLIDIAKCFGGKAQCLGEYPAWEFNKDSQLRELMCEIYENQYGEKPQLQAIHAGLECGIFQGKLQGLDSISFGPNIYDIHTVNEKLSISSTERVWNMLLEIIEKSK